MYSWKGIEFVIIFSIITHFWRKYLYLNLRDNLIGALKPGSKNV